MTRVVPNVLLFQAGWFACVLGAAWSMPWLALVAAVPVIGWHVARARGRSAELGLIAAAAACGLAFETLLARSGWVRFESGVLLDGTAPYWMVLLWAFFATTLNVSLRWLRERPVAAMVLGALGGPAAYWSGERLGALEFTAAGAALLAIGIGWALLTPLLLAAALRLDGYAPAA